MLSSLLRSWGTEPINDLLQLEHEVCFKPWPWDPKIRQKSLVIFTWHAISWEWFEQVLAEYSHWLTCLCNMTQELFQNRTIVFLVLLLKLCKPKRWKNLNKNNYKILTKFNHVDFKIQRLKKKNKGSNSSVDYSKHLLKNCFLEMFRLFFYD